MLVTGEGALCARALRFCASAGLPVEAVISRAHMPGAVLSPLRCSFRETVDVNNEWEFIRDNAKDGIVWSLNNPFLLREQLLNLPNLTFYNIHNGLVQKHRGLPEISILFAILHGEAEYGATLHKIDSGIDTGPVVAQRSFHLTSDDTFGSVIDRSLECCAALFAEQCPRILSTRPVPLAVDRSQSRNFSYRNLPEALDFRGHPNWSRATDLRPYQGHFPRLAGWLSEHVC